MPKKPSNPEDAPNLSNVTRFAQRPKEPASKDRSGPMALPTACVLTVTLDDIVPYDHNPRQALNPLHDDIRESIRSRGLDHPPNITLRPGDEKYMIRDGGNTRLQALAELYEETGDLRYYQIQCKYRPWVSEIDTLAGHLVENELHGRMLFIDRARAAVKMRYLFQQERNEEISGRELAKLISATGWTMNAGDLTSLLYAAEHLFAYMPDAFWGGLGRKMVRQIRGVENAARQYLSSVAGHDREFLGMWWAALSDADDVPFDLRDLKSALSNRIADRLQIKGLRIVDAEIEAILHGSKPPKYSPPIPLAPGPADSPVPQTSRTPEAPEGPEGPSPSGLQAPLAPDGPAGSPEPQTSGTPEAPADPPGAQAPLAPAGPAGSPEPQTSGTPEAPADPPGAQAPLAPAGPADQTVQDQTGTVREEAAVRARIQDRVLALASSVGMGHVVIVNDELRLGYECDLDRVEVLDSMDLQQLVQLAMVALLTQWQKIESEHPDRVEDTNEMLCTRLFGGDWRLFGVAMGILQAMRLEPRYHEAHPGRGLDLLPVLEADVLRWNRIAARAAKAD